MGLGRKTRLQEPQCAIIWSIFEHVRTALKSEEMITRFEMFTRLAAYYASNVSVPFDFVVANEAQDLSVAQLRFLAALGKYRGDSLFFCGEPGTTYIPATLFLEGS
jgi:hypothetical protein